MNSTAIWNWTQQKNISKKLHLSLSLSLSLVWLKFASHNNSSTPCISLDKIYLVYWWDRHLCIHARLVNAPCRAWTQPPYGPEHNKDNDSKIWSYYLLRTVTTRTIFAQSNLSHTLCCSNKPILTISILLCQTSGARFSPFVLFFFFFFFLFLFSLFHTHMRQLQSSTQNARKRTNDSIQSIT